jgi:hypothetical protein
MNSADVKKEVFVLFALRVEPIPYVVREEYVFSQPRTDICAHLKTIDDGITTRGVRMRL